MSNNYLVPDIIKDLLSKMINATSQNERQAYELQIRTIRDACNTALGKIITTPVKTRKRA
jgi:hypothetical protein